MNVLNVEKFATVGLFNNCCLVTLKNGPLHTEKKPELNGTTTWQAGHVEIYMIFMVFPSRTFLPLNLLVQFVGMEDTIIHKWVNLKYLGRL